MQLHIECIHEEQITVCTSFHEQFKRFSKNCQLCLQLTQYLNRVFRISTRSSKTQSKFVAK